MEVQSFAEIEVEFIERVHRMVWCNMATLDLHNRPRSRLLHTIWEGNTGWIITRRHSHKAKHLGEHPYVSLAYIADIVKPVYADCLVEWEDSTANKQRIWDLFLAAPPPLGYDPGTIFPSVDDPGCGLLKLMPWRIELADVTGVRRVWRSKSAV